MLKSSDILYNITTGSFAEPQDSFKVMSLGTFDTFVDVLFVSCEDRLLLIDVSDLPGTLPTNLPIISTITSDSTVSGGNAWYEFAVTD